MDKAIITKCRTPISSNRVTIKDITTPTCNISNISSTICRLNSSTVDINSRINSSNRINLNSINNPNMVLLLMQVLGELPPLRMDKFITTIKSHRKHSGTSHLECFSCNCCSDLSRAGSVYLFSTHNTYHHMSWELIALVCLQWLLCCIIHNCLDACVVVVAVVQRCILFLE